jgi:hypothetical protein
LIAPQFTRVAPDENRAWLSGTFCGCDAGGVIGVGLGFLWIKVFHTSDFEGYSGMLVFYTFMPIGIIVGALLGGVGLGFVGGRDDSERRPTGEP